MKERNFTKQGLFSAGFTTAKSRAFPDYFNESFLGSSYERTGDIEYQEET
jgi:hypothetical protein